MSALAPPAAGRPRPLKIPSVAERKLRSGLHVLAVRKPTVPRVELVLYVPLGRRSPSAAPERLLAKTLTSGTSDLSSDAIADELQRLGASIDVGSTPDHVTVSASALSANLDPLLRLLADVLADAAFPADEVEMERQRVVQEIEIARSQPQFIATEAVRRRLFGRHPYSVVQPLPDAVKKVGPGTLRRLRNERVVPRRAIAVVVGDLQPQRALDRIEQALQGWRGRSAVPDLPVPPNVKPGPLTLVHRADAVQTNIRLAAPVPPIGHPDSYPLSVGNTIFGGSATSRLFENLRERRGYTYSPFSRSYHLQRASYFEVALDVATDVTAPALVEARYEVGRMAVLPVTDDELRAAKRYLIGITSIVIQSQRGLANQLGAQMLFGLGVDYLKELPKRIEAVTLDDVREVWLKHLAPMKVVAVLVGDAQRIEREVEALHHVDVMSP